MKKHVSTILICTLLLICIIQHILLNERMDRLQTQIDQSLSTATSAVQNAVSSFDQKLSQEASLLAFSDYSFEEIDEIGHTAVLNYSVTPKELIPGQTTAILICNEEKYPMEYRNGNDGMPL